MLLGHLDGHPALIFLVFGVLELQVHILALTAVKKLRNESEEIQVLHLLVRRLEVVKCDRHVR